MVQLSDYVTYDAATGQYVAKDPSTTRVYVKEGDVYVDVQSQEYEQYKDTSISGGPEIRRARYSPLTVRFDPKTGIAKERYTSKLVETRTGSGGSIIKQDVVPVQVQVLSPSGTVTKEQNYISFRGPGGRLKTRTEERYYEQQEQEARRIREGRKVGETQASAAGRRKAAALKSVREEQAKQQQADYERQVQQTQLYLGVSGKEAARIVREQNAQGNVISASRTQLLGAIAGRQQVRYAQGSTNAAPAFSQTVVTSKDKVREQQPIGFSLFRSGKPVQPVENKVVTGAFDTYIGNVVTSQQAFTATTKVQPGTSEKQFVEPSIFIGAATQEVKGTKAERIAEREANKFLPSNILFKEAVKQQTKEQVRQIQSEEYLSQLPKAVQFVTKPLVQTKASTFLAGTSGIAKGGEEFVIKVGDYIVNEPEKVAGVAGLAYGAGVVVGALPVAVGVGLGVAAGAAATGVAALQSYTAREEAKAQGKSELEIIQAGATPIGTVAAESAALFLPFYGGVKTSQAVKTFPIFQRTTTTTTLKGKGSNDVQEAVVRGIRKTIGGKETIKATGIRTTKTGITEIKGTVGKNKFTATQGALETRVRIVDKKGKVIKEITRPTQTLETPLLIAQETTATKVSGVEKFTRTTSEVVIPKTETTKGLKVTTVKAKGEVSTLEKTITATEPEGVDVVTRTFKPPIESKKGPETLTPFQERTGTIKTTVTEKFDPRVKVQVIKDTPEVPIEIELKGFAKKGSLAGTRPSTRFIERFGVSERGTVRPSTKSIETPSGKIIGGRGVSTDFNALINQVAKLAPTRSLLAVPSAGGLTTGRATSLTIGVPDLEVTANTLSPSVSEPTVNTTPSTTPTADILGITEPVPSTTPGIDTGTGTTPETGSPSLPVTDIGIGSPRIPNFTIPDFPAFPGLPKLPTVPRGQMLGGRYSYRKVFKTPKAYTPTATAAALNIRGKRSKVGEVTGLGFRPLPTQTKKRRKKRR